MSSAIDRSNICDECPFGYSLSVHTAELDEPADDMSEIRLEMLRNETENAARILNVAAGEIACRDTVKKKLPPRIAPEELPGSVGSSSGTCPNVLVSRNMRNYEKPI
jgi:hypothetical protein